jgi:2-succinyl-5-enolpyruvyl-6-hydroxy-3-cyclohexene-1-carboxylate synthase
VNPSTAQASALVDELCANGVREVVLCPGSRNAPLSMALHAADAAGRVRLHVRIDERGAGFLALGLARASGVPAVVVTTSGTAVANLHPAVLEAHHGAVPLVVLSADRPAHLRGVGANQVIDQLTLFGSGVLRYQHEIAVATAGFGRNGYWRGQVCRAVAASLGAFASGRPGPAHLNIPFDVPLLPDGETAEYDAVLGRTGSNPVGLGGAAAPAGLGGRGGLPWTRIPAPGDTGSPVAGPGVGEKCLFIGDLTHPLAAAVAAAGYPVVSEAGGLGGADVLAAGVHLLADEDFLGTHLPDRVIVLGRPTLFRPVTALLGRVDIVIDVVDNPGGYADLAGSVRAVAPTLADVPPAAETAPADWLASWRGADAAASSAIDAALSGRDIANSAVLARAVAAGLPAGATLFLGSSQTPRDIGRFTRPRNGIRVLANRGVAGIDGTVSTAIGSALAAGPDHATYALMGDLAFLYDVNALAIGPHEPRPDLTVVVANNDGGGIFATLEQGAPRYAASFERVFGTPTGAEIAGIVEGFGAEHLLAITAGELAEALSEPPSGLCVVEVPVTRTDLRALAAEIAAAVADALRGQ